VRHFTGSSSSTSKISSSLSSRRRESHFGAAATYAAGRWVSKETTSHGTCCVAQCTTLEKRDRPWECQAERREWTVCVGAWAAGLDRGAGGMYHGSGEKVHGPAGVEVPVE
jgi:hypothetical protein